MDCFAFLSISFFGFFMPHSTNTGTELEAISGDNVEEQLAVAEREFLQTRSTYTVRRKAARTILMTDPILKAVHLKTTSPPERFVFPVHVLVLCVS